MRLVAVLAVLTVAAFGFACDTEDESGAGATSAVTPTAPGDRSPTASPTPSTACPLERDICGQGEGAFLQIRALAMSALFHQNADAVPVREFGADDRVLPPENVVQVLEKWIARADPTGSDAHGTGEVRIEAVGCRRDEPACETERATALTMLRVGDGARAALVLVFRGRDQWVERIEQGSYDDLDETDFEFKPYRFDEGPALVIPAMGGPCPVEQDVCDVALRIRDTIRQGDVDALMATAVPTMRRCADLSFADDICDGLSADVECPASAWADGRAKAACSRRSASGRCWWNGSRPDPRPPATPIHTARRVSRLRASHVSGWARSLLSALRTSR
jgi:hypothetical protein